MFLFSLNHSSFLRKAPLGFSSMSDRFWYTLRKSRFSASVTPLLDVFSGCGSQAGLSVGPGRAMRRGRFAHDGAGVQYATLPDPNPQGCTGEGRLEASWFLKKSLTEKDIDRFGYIGGQSGSFSAVGVRIRYLFLL